MDAGVLWARAVGVGSIAFFLGIAGHVTADGLLPGPLLLSTFFALSVLLSAPVLSRPAGRLRMVGLLVGGQTAIHLALSVTAGHTGRAPVATGPRHASADLGSLPVVDGRRIGSLQDAYDAASGQSDLAPALPVGHLLSDLSDHAPMMVGHLAAAALVGLWLAHGERCLWTVLALTGRRIHAAVLLLVPVALPVTRSAYAADRALTGPRSPWLVRPHSRRGPPLLAA